MRGNDFSGDFNIPKNRLANQTRSVILIGLYLVLYELRYEFIIEFINLYFSYVYRDLLLLLCLSNHEISNTILFALRDIACHLRWCSLCRGDARIDPQAFGQFAHLVFSQQQLQFWILQYRKRGTLCCGHRLCQYK